MASTTDDMLTRARGALVLHAAAAGLSAVGSRAPSRHPAGHVRPITAKARSGLVTWMVTAYLWTRSNP